MSVVNHSVSVSALVTFAAAVSVAGIASAGSFSITTPGSNNNTAVGQNFSPSVGNSGGSGASATDNVSLNSLSFTKGSAATGNAATRLVILSGAFYDTNGGDGTFHPTTADATAVSTNTLDTTGTDGTALNFTFSGASLVYGQNYTAVFATVGAGNVLSFIPVGVKYVDYIESPPGSGTYVPSSNYGGTGNYNATALYPDSDNDGYFQADNNAADLAFTANFSTVPEPTSLAAVLGATTMFTRRRK